MQWTEEAVRPRQRGHLRHQGRWCLRFEMTQRAALSLALARLVVAECSRNHTLYFICRGDGLATGEQKCVCLCVCVWNGWQKSSRRRDQEPSPTPPTPSPSNRRELALSIRPSYDRARLIAVNVISMHIQVPEQQGRGTKRPVSPAEAHRSIPFGRSAATLIVAESWGWAREMLSIKTRFIERETEDGVCFHSKNPATPSIVSCRPHICSLFSFVCSGATLAVC